MAEINDIEDENEIEENLDLDEPVMPLDTGFLSKVKALLSSPNGRFIKIGAAVLGLLLVVGLVTLLWSSGSSDLEDVNTSTMSPQELQAHFNTVAKKKAKKTKKKKIKYEVLFKALEGDVLSEVLKELTYANIPFSLTQSGTQYDVSVDSERVEEAKTLLAIKGLPTGSKGGYAIFDDASNLGVTEFDKRIRLIRAISGEMENSINAFEAVSNSRVSVVIPEERLFAAIQPPVTASILLKRAEGRVITDEVVFAIIQLVANSVENLDPANITVVDTEGHVLSTGVMQRVGQRTDESTGLQMPSRAQMGTQRGVAVVPNNEDISNWFQLKYQYESILEQKATKQLEGVLPKGAYKVAVTVDLDGSSSSGTPDIKQILTSVVVDNTRDDINLDSFTTQQIYNVISGAIGYVRGRDKILLSKANFESQGLKTELSQGDEPSSNQPKKQSVLDSALSLGRYWQIPAMGALVMGLFLLIGKGISLVRGKVKKDTYVSSNDFDDAPNYEKLEVSPVQSDLLEEKPVLSSPDLTKVIQKVEEEPAVVASMLRTWLQEEGDQNG